MPYKIPTTTQPEAGYYHVRLIEIDNLSKSMRWLFDELGVDTDRILRERFDDTTLTLEQALADEDPRVLELASRIYQDIRALSLIMTERKAAASAQPEETRND
jgi:hypothetical protein